MACFISVHGFASTVTLILSVKPYRQAAGKLFNKWILREFGICVQELVKSSGSLKRARKFNSSQANHSKTLFKSRSAPNPTSCDSEKRL